MMTNEARTPFEVSLTMAPHCGRDYSGSSIIERHPVAGWTRTGEPVIVHWQTGRLMPFSAFLNERDPDRTEVVKWSFGRVQREDTWRKW